MNGLKGTTGGQPAGLAPPAESVSKDSGSLSGNGRNVKTVRQDYYDLIRRAINKANETRDGKARVECPQAIWELIAKEAYDLGHEDVWAGLLGFLKRIINYSELSGKDKTALNFYLHQYADNREQAGFNVGFGLGLQVGLSTLFKLGAFNRCNLNGLVESIIAESLSRMPREVDHGTETA